MPLTPEEEAVLKKFRENRKAYDNSEGMLLRSGSIARDQAGLSGIDEGIDRNRASGPGERPSTPEELAIMNQVRQGLDQSRFRRAAMGGLLESQQAQAQQAPTYPRRTTDTVIEQNNIPPKWGGGIGNVIESVFGGGKPGIGQSAPSSPQIGQPTQPQQQGGQNWAQAMLEGFGAGVQGMSVPNMRLRKAQAQMAQYEVMDQQRTQAAIQNYPAFSKKMKAYKPFYNQFVAQKKKENPNFEPDINTFMEASEAWDAAFPEMAINQTDQDTLNRTAQGMQFSLSLGLLPLKDMLEVRKIGLSEDARQKAAFQASLLGAPKTQADIDYAQQAFGGGQQGQPVPQIGQPLGQSQSPPQIGQPPPQAQAQAGESLGGRVQNVPATVPQGGPLTPYQQGIQSEVINQRAGAFGAGLEAQAKSKIGLVPPMSGAEANALMRQRMAPLLNDPSELNFYGEGQKVSLDQLNKDAEELGKNLRSSKTAESRDALQSERLKHKSSEADKTREAASSLASMKAENMSERLEKSHDLKMRLFTMGEKFKDARQRNTFSQQQQRDQFKAEASINKQRELLQTQAGIAFTKEAIQNDADTAIKFALEAERAGNVTARGLIGDVLETNPSLAWPILERLGTLSKENGLSSNSVTAVKGAIEDYMKRRSSFTSEEMAQDIINGPGTDKDKNTKLAMELRKAKQAGNAKAEDYYKFLLDSRKSSGQTINIDNRPPPEGGVGLGKALSKEQTQQLIGTQDAIGLIGDLRGYISTTPLAGVSGLSERIQNYVTGTMYDFSRIKEGVGDETYRKKFNPNIDPGTLLTNQLKYVVARAREPGGRLSDQDIDRVNIGTGITDNTLSLESTINGLEKEMFRAMSEISERLSDAGVKLVPTASDRDLIIQNLASDPDYQKYSQDTLKIMVQDMFLKGSNVMIGKTELNDVLREIKKRRK